MTTARQILDIYRSGHVQRYHQNPSLAWLGQTNAAHQWGVAMLLRELFPLASGSLMRETLYHDAGEMGACDASSPAKTAHPEMAKAIARAEETERWQMGIALGGLTPKEEQILRLCDRLEALLFVATRAPWVLETGDWPEARQEVFAMAEELGVGDKVSELLRCM